MRRRSSHGVRSRWHGASQWRARLTEEGYVGLDVHEDVINSRPELNRLEAELAPDELTAAHKVTVAGKPGAEVPRGTAANILRQAGLRRPSR
jgi:hypothetical protein